jgi:hypothetical protein
MEPPPPSLEALVRSRPGSPLTPTKSRHWLWIAVAIVIIGVGMYYVGLHR